MAMLEVVSLGLPLRVEAPAARAAAGLPRRFWMYAGFAVLYGVCETVNGNWSQVEMTTKLGASNHVLPFLLAGTFVVIAVLPDGATAAGIAAFGVAGLGCGVGPLLDHGVKLSTVYASSAVVAVAMGFASFGVTLRGARDVPDPARLTATS